MTILFLKFSGIKKFPIDTSSYFAYYIPMSDQPTKYYRTIEVAEMFNVSQRTIAQWINDGDIKATKLNPLKENSPFIISQSEVDRMMNLRKLGEG